MIRKFTSKTFRYDQDFKNTDFRKNPDLYQVGRGEQGVLLIEPYKSEILPYWRFKDQKIAGKSSRAIYRLFLKYKKDDDFVGMDMARKFLQMGYTRARRYANHPSGKKFVSNPQKEDTGEAEKEARKATLPQSDTWNDNEKAEAAKIFYAVYFKVKNNPKYVEMKNRHVELYG